MHTVSESEWRAFRRFAITKMHLKADSTLPDTVRKLIHMSNPRIYGDLAVNLSVGEGELEQQVDDWVFTRMEEGNLTKSGANHYYKAINRWCAFKGYTLHFKLYAATRTPQFTPTPDQVRRCINVWHRRNKIHRRNRTMLVVLAGSGLRISEFVNIEIADIDFERNTITVKRGKGGGGRVVYVDPKVIGGRNYPSIRNYIDKWRYDTHSTALWTGRKGEMTIDYTRKIIKDTGRAAAVPQLHPHALRRFFAVTMLRAGVSIKAIQKQLGHKKLDTTDIYLQGITDRDVMFSIRSANIPDPLTVTVKYLKPMKPKNRGGYAESTDGMLYGPEGMYKNPFIGLDKRMGIFDGDLHPRGDDRAP